MVADFLDGPEDAIWLVSVLVDEGVDGDDGDEAIVVGVSSSRSGLLLGPRKRDRLADLSADGRLVVHFAYADQSEPINNVFKQILGAARGRR